MAFICPSTYAMNMTRRWSDHYKLVILERRGTKEQRGKGTKLQRRRQREEDAKAQSRKTILLYPFVPQVVGGILDFGRVRVKVLPCPEVLVTAMSPWWARAKALARLRPRPVPGWDRL